MWALLWLSAMTEIVGGTSADRKAIDALHDRDAAASQAQDFKVLRELLSEDAVLLPPGGVPVQGRKQLDANLASQQGTASAFKILSYRFVWEEIRILGDFAYEWGTIVGEIKPAGGGEITLLRYNVMRVLHRDASGEWKVHRSIWNAQS
jgi:uncharacterized protein (TIGR02246 family)